MACRPRPAGSGIGGRLHRITQFPRAVSAKQGLSSPAGRPGCRRRRSHTVRRIQRGVCGPRSGAKPWVACVAPVHPGARATRKAGPAAAAQGSEGRVAGVHVPGATDIGKTLDKSKPRRYDGSVEVEFRWWFLETTPKNRSDRLQAERNLAMGQYHWPTQSQAQFFPLGIVAPLK